MTLKVYGPYLRADGRRHVIWYDTETGKRTTQSYSRLLMEPHLGRKLLECEQVDHINEDGSDDRIENYQLMSQIENIRKSAKQPEYGWFVCPWCKVEFKRLMSYYRKNQIKCGKSGPYCSRQCAGKMHN